MTNLVLKSEHYVNGKTFLDRMILTQHGDKFYIAISNGKSADGTPRSGKIHLSSEQMQAIAEWVKGTYQW